MLRHHLFATCLLFATLVAPPAFARDCPKGTSWECFTEVSVDTADFKLHVAVFDNQEMMGEMEQAGRLRRIIVAGPNKPSLYAGMTSAEMAHTNALHFMIPVSTVTRALARAFPRGPDSVPERATTVSAGADRITAARNTAGSISYTMDSAEFGKASGVYSTRRLLPLADDYPVSEWQLANGRRFRRLGELRSGAMPPPEPVSSHATAPAIQPPDVSKYPVRAAPAGSAMSAAAAAPVSH